MTGHTVTGASVEDRVRRECSGRCWLRDQPGRRQLSARAIRVLEGSPANPTIGSSVRCSTRRALRLREARSRPESQDGYTDEAIARICSTLESQASTLVRDTTPPADAESRG